MYLWHFIFVATMMVRAGAAPMFFASGFFYNNVNNSTSFSNLSLAVMVQGAENVMVVSNPNSKRIASAWGERGGIYAMHVARTSTNWSLEHFLGQGNRSYGVDLAATVFERFLQPDEGFQYLIVDEVGNDAALWKNGGEMAWRFEEWLQRLAKDGYDHRVLLYFNLYNMVQTITEFGQVLRACAGHCRAVAAEIYLSTGVVQNPEPETPGHCTSNISCFESIAAQLDNIVPGVNNRTITFIGVTDDYLQQSTRSDALCASNPRGSLRKQYDAIQNGHFTSQQPGIGWWSLHYVTVKQEAVASCIHDLSSQWQPWSPGPMHPLAVRESSTGDINENILESVVELSVRMHGALTRVSPSFLGVNIDAASLYEGTRLDFTDPQLRALGRVLGQASPHAMVLRVGGSTADDLSFRSDDNNVTVHIPFTYWDQMLGFVHSAGLVLAFDLNAMSMRDNHAGVSVWNASDAKLLIRHMKESNQSVYAFQLGNEPGHWQTRHGGPSPEEHGADFVVLRDLLKENFPGEMPRIQGPDVCFGRGTNDSPCASEEYLQTLLNASSGVLNDITVHNYGLTGPKKGRSDQCGIEEFLSPSLWEQHLTPTLKLWKSVQQTTYPKSRLVLSETATAADAGCPHLSNSFVSGFYFVDVLGFAGELGYSQVYRQDLVGFSGVNGGSNYALAGDPGWHNASANGELIPNPDFFTAVAWRQLMGPQRLRLEYDQSQIRLYAACDNRRQHLGGVVIAFVNPSDSAIKINLTYAGSRAREVAVYSFSAPGNNLTARQMMLNGELLRSADQQLEGAQTPLGDLSLPPLTYGFVADPSAGVTECSCADPRDFGAVEGNPGRAPGFWQRNQRAIQAAIDTSACVEVAGGDYATGDLYLKSNSTFRIAADSRLLASINNTRTSLLHIENADNVVLGGHGTLYGNAEFAYSYYSSVDNRFQPCLPDGRRPHLLIVHNSNNVQIRDLHFHNSTDWNIQVRKSTNVLIESVDIYGDQRFPNNDGIEPDSCTNLTIRHSRIDVADDGISPISSVQDGPLKNLHVYNTTIRSKSHAIKFGSTCNADCTDAVFENITIWDSNSGLAIQQRGAGDIRNVTFRDIRVQTRYQAPRWWGNGEWLSVTVEPRFNSSDKVGRVSGLRIERVSARSENGGFLSGIPGVIGDVAFIDVDVKIVTGIGNYSSGRGPPCCVPGGSHNITCMGTLDHRPSFREDFGCTLFGNCRTPGNASALRVENVYGLRFENFKGSFGDPVEPWFDSQRCVLVGCVDVVGTCVK